jgi:hypothetical protein
MTAPIRNFAELADRLPDLGYSERMTAQIRPEINRAAKIYKQPLARISTDPLAFETLWGRGRISWIAKGFESHEQFLTFRRRLRPALQRASGIQLRHSVALPAPTSELLTFLEENGGIGRRLPPHLAASIGALGREAAKLGLSIADMRPGSIARVFGKLTGGARRSAKLGVTRVNELIADLEQFPELAGLLPAMPLPDPVPAVSASSQWRRGTGFAPARRLWSDFEEFVEHKRGRDALGRPIPAEKSKFKAITEDSYAHNVNLALTELVRRGDLTDDMTPSLRDICNERTISKVAGYWNVRQLDGEVKAKVSTLHTLVCRLSHIAETMGVKKKEAKALAELRKTALEACPAVGKMMKEHVDWIRGYAANPGLQRALDGLPEDLMYRAKKILAKWPMLKKQRKQKLMMQALQLGIAACIAAILFRASPIRAANLRHLKFQGDDSNLPRENGELRIVICGSEVKNGADIDHDADDDAWPIIDWYLKHIRPKLLLDHPYLRKSLKPLVDSDFLFPSTRADRPLEETSLAKHYVDGCLVGGLAMVLHRARHITVYRILLQDPNAWAQAAAVLEDEISTVKKHYAWLDKRRASEAGRDLMRQSRVEARRHKKGKAIA